MFLWRIKEKLPGNKQIKLNNLSKQILRIFHFSLHFLISIIPLWSTITCNLHIFVVLLFNWINSISMLLWTRLPI